MTQKSSGAFVNKVYKGWAHLEFKRNGGTVVDFTGIDYGDEVDDELVYGAGRAPLGVGRGDYKPDVVKVTLYREEADKLVEDLSKDGPIYEHKPFDGVCSYRDEESGKVISDHLKGLRLKKIPNKAKRGDKTLEVEVEFLCAGGIWRNGKKPVSTGTK